MKKVSPPPVYKLYRLVCRSLNMKWSVSCADFSKREFAFIEDELIIKTIEVLIGAGLIK